MGLFSSSKSSTVNEDNRTINDLSGSEFFEDNSQDNSIEGELNNNSGTINIVDGGAFDVVSAANDNAALLSADAIAQVSSIAGNALELSDSLFSTGASLVDNASARGLDAALAVHTAGAEQLQLGSELTLALAQQNTDAALEQQADNNNALTNGFASAMQFVEDFSRSDGNEIANTNLKVVGVVVVGVVLSVFLFNRK